MFFFLFSLMGEKDRGGGMFFTYLFWSPVVTMCVDAVSTAIQRMGPDLRRFSRAASFRLCVVWVRTPVLARTDSD